MKVYITHQAGWKETGQGAYIIITEEGEILASHFCSHIGFAFGDLTEDRINEKRISAWKERFREVDILHLYKCKDPQSIEDNLIIKNKEWSEKHPNHVYPKPSVSIETS